MTRPPEVSLSDDGTRLLWSHECNFPDLFGSTWHAATPLPVGDTDGWAWRVESADPLTVSPSILCRSCGTHGFWRAGAWVPA